MRAATGPRGGTPPRLCGPNQGAADRDRQPRAEPANLRQLAGRLPSRFLEELPGACRAYRFRRESRDPVPAATSFRRSVPADGAAAPDHRGVGAAGRPPPTRFRSVPGYSTRNSATASSPRPTTTSWTSVRNSRATNACWTGSSSAPDLSATHRRCPLETVAVSVPEDALEPFEAALLNACETVGFFRDEDTGLWRLEG